MIMNKIAKELVAIAKELTAARKLEYEVADMIAESMDETWGIDSVGVSDGEYDDTIFTFYVELTPTYLESDARGRPGYPAGFHINLRKFKGMVNGLLKILPRIKKRELQGVDEYGREFELSLRLASVTVPRQKRWPNRELVIYEHNRANFQVLMLREYK